MSPRSNPRFAPAPLLLALLAVAPGALRAQLPLVTTPRDDPEAREAVLGFLDSIGPSSAQAVLLEQIFAETRQTDERIRLAHELARVYAVLIEHTENEDTRDRLERRALDLVEKLPASGANAARIELTATLYQRARVTAERARFGLIDPPRRRAVGERLAELGGRFTEYAADAARREESLNARTRAGAGTALVAEALRLARSERSRANFLAGYSYLYASSLLQADDFADRAIDRFGLILNAPDGPADPASVRAGLLSVGYIAEAALGAAWAEGLRGAPAIGLLWIDTLVNDLDAADHLGEAATMVHIELLTSLRRWEEAGALIDGDRASIRLVRFAARTALHADTQTPSRTRASMRDRMIALLVARGEIGHALDVVGDAPTGALDGDGSLALLAQGLSAYAHARDQHRDTLGSKQRLARPIADRTLAEAYRRAAMDIASVMVNGLDETLQPARASLLVILGESRFLSAVNAEWDDPAYAVLAQACDNFADAADHHNDPSAAQASLWQAVLAASLAVEHAESAEIDQAEFETLLARRARNADLYIARYPDSVGAARLAVDRAAQGEMPPEAAIRELLAVPEGSAEYKRARREAVRLAHALFRDAPQSETPWHAARFTQLAMPIFELDRQAAQTGIASLDDARAAADRALALGRLIIEASFVENPQQITRADAVLSQLEELGMIGVIDLADVRDELDYQRARLLLAQERPDAAQRIIDDLASREGPFAEAASMLGFDHAVRDLRQSLDSAGIFIVPPAPVTAAAEALLAVEMDVVPETPVGVAVVIAEAAALLWRADEENAPSDRAVAALSIALRERPRDPRVLEAAAWIEQARGNTNGALDHWRVLGAGLEPETPAWFGARYKLISLIAGDDPERATSLLRAHAALYAPSMGLPPWNAPLRQLHERLLGPVPESEDDLR